MVKDNVIPFEICSFLVAYRECAEEDKIMASKLFYLLLTLHVLVKMVEAQRMGDGKCFPPYAIICFGMVFFILMIKLMMVVVTTERCL